MSEAQTVAAESAEAPQATALTPENSATRWREEMEAIASSEDDAPPEEPAKGPDEEDTEEAQPSADISAIRKALKGRNLEEAAKLLGVDVTELGIDKREHQALRKARQRAEAEQEKSAQLRAELSTEKERIKEASAHFGEIAEKYRAGDYSGAIEALFGVEFAKVQEMLTEQHADPARREILRMRRELEERTKADEQARKTRETQELSAAQERQVESYLDDVATKLPAVAAKYAPLAEDRRFLRAVFDRQAAHYREEGTHLPLGRAVRETAEQIRQSLVHWRTLLAEGQEPQPSGGKSQSVARGATPKATKSVTTAQGPSGPPKPVTRETADAEWARISAEASRIP